MKKNIAFIHGQMVIGGAERVLINLLHHLDYERYDIFLFIETPIPQNEEGLEHLIDKRVRIAYWQDMDLQTGSPFLHSIIFDCAIAYQGLNTHHLDLLNKHIKAKKKIAWIHGDCRYECTESRHQEFLEKYIYLDKIFCVSKGVRQIFVDVFPQLYSLTAVHYNLLDEDEITKKADIVVDDPLFDGFSILSVGRISHEKGHILIPKTAKLLKDAGFAFKWYIVGDGDCRTQVEDEIKKYDVEDCVIIKGYKRNPYPYIKQCSLFVLPSFSEGYCTVTIEALLLKKSIVATPVCGIDEQIKDGQTGIISKATTSEALFESINKYLSDKGLQSVIQRTVFQEKFDNTEELEKLYSFIESDKLKRKEDGILISIVIPVYNVEKYLRKTLESIVFQTYRKLEIICVNDGSTDSSLKILEDFAGFDERIKILNQENSGLFIARKNGIMASSGDYILCIDSDDWLDKNGCQCFEELIKEKPEADIIQYGVTLEGEFKDAIALSARLNTTVTSVHGNDQMLTLCYNEKAIPWNIATKVIRGDIARNVYGIMPAVRFGQLEDFIGNFYVMAMSHSWYSVANKIYHYRMGTGMATSQPNSSDFDVHMLEKTMGYLEAFKHAKLWAETQFPNNKVICDIVNHAALDYVFAEPFACFYTKSQQKDLPDELGSLIEQRLGLENTLKCFVRTLNFNWEELNIIENQKKKISHKLCKYRRLTKGLVFATGLLLIIVIALLFLI